MTNYGLHENLAKNLVFIDGLSRSGKSTLSGIVSSFENFEHIQFFSLLEWIIPAMSVSKLDPSFARSLLRTQLNELAYNMKLSRHVNFRFGDQSSIYNYRDPKKYVERLAREEGDGVVEELREGVSSMLFQTHELMVNLEHLNQCELDYRMLSLWRHPIDNIYSFWTRGLGERFGVDPREFTLAIEYKGQTLPWYCAGYEAKWLEANAMERCILIGVDLLNKASAQYQVAVNKDRIHIFTFEDLVQSPDKEVQKICDFLHTQRTPETARFIQEARCPRIIDLEERMRKQEEFNRGVRAEFFSELMTCAERYENNLYGLKELAS